MPLNISSTSAHNQEVIIASHSLWYLHTETSVWSKINKIQFYKYEQIAVKCMCEFFVCDYCVLLTVNSLCHVQVMFIQLLNLLQRHYVYLHLCLLTLTSHKILQIPDWFLYLLGYVFPVVRIFKNTLSIYITDLNKLCLSSY